MGRSHGTMLVGMRVVNLVCHLAEYYLVFIDTEATENFKEDGWIPLTNAHREAFLGCKEEAQRCLCENAAIEG